MMGIVRLIAGALGFSTLKLMVIAGMVAASLTLVTGVGVKIYLSGKHSAQLAQERANNAALVRGLKADAQTAKQDLAEAKVDLAKQEELLNELENHTGACLDDDVVKRLRDVIGR